MGDGVGNVVRISVGLTHRCVVLGAAGALICIRRFGAKVERLRARVRA